MYTNLGHVDDNEYKQCQSVPILSQHELNNDNDPHKYTRKQVDVYSHLIHHQFSILSLESPFYSVYVSLNEYIMIIH